MEKRHQTLLERNYSALLTSMEVEKVLDCMRESSLFGLDSEEVDRAAHGPTRRERARLVIAALMRKGPRAFPFFVHALYVTSAHKALAEKLATEGGVSIEELKPRPQPQPVPAAAYAAPRAQQPAQVSSQAHGGLPPLPFNNLPLEDDPQLYYRRDIYGERATVRAMPVSEESHHRGGRGELVFGTRSFSFASHRS